MSKPKHFHLGALLAAALSFFLAMPASADSWLFYVWLVGSDLESDGGAATMDIQEMMQAQENLPKDDIKVLIQTGGSKEWHAGDIISASKSQRWLIDSEDLHPLESLSLVNMGTPEALADFLEYGKKNYKADHRVLIFWDHGGGPVAGVGFDELHPANNEFGIDFLSLSEISQAIEQVYGEEEKRPFDIIGFDACLQSSIESLQYVGLFADYMVASEETEPGNGWYYTGILNGLSKNTSMSAEELGRLIVDSYHQGCKEVGTDAQTTLSLTHAGNSAPFILAMQDFSDGLATKVLEAKGSGRKGLISKIDRVARNVTKYGSDGTDSIDVGEFLEGVCSDSSFQDVCGNVQQAYNDVVLYSTTGDSMSGTGLSMYYPLTNQLKAKHFNAVLQNGYFPSYLLFVQGMMAGTLNEQLINSLYEDIDSWRNYYQQLLTATGSGAGQAGASGGSESQEGGAESSGEAASAETGSGGESGEETDETKPSAAPSEGGSGTGLAGLSQSLVAQAASMQSLNSEIQKDDGISKLGEIAVKLKDDGTSYIEIPKEYLSSVSRVTYVMGSYSEEDKKEGTPAFIMIIGEGGQLTADWDKGIFSDKFGGAWPMLGDSMLSLEVTNVTDRYITYDSHVKVNKKDASMNIVYDIKSNTYKIIGYTPIDESGIAQRSVRFKKGDEITTVMSAVSLEDESREWDTDMETYKYSDDLKIEAKDMGSDVTLLMYYQVTDFKGNEATSSMVAYQLKEERMNVQLFDDWAAENSGASGAEGESGNADGDGEGAGKGEAKE